jgi:glycine cleavage system H lipoate-binding protein
MQYCEAAPRQKLVPSGEPALTRCGSGAYRYCSLYLDLAQSAQETEQLNDAMPVPAGLRYTRNHFWIDWPEDGPWHIGIDSFLARMIGQVDRILFLAPLGLARPAVALSIGEAELHLVFPEPLHITGRNVYLRSTPARLTSDPYTHGWLYEGTAGQEPRQRVLQRLLSAEQARSHMEKEAQRLRHWVELLHGAACDGGLFHRGLLRELGREDALQLFYEYCSPAAGA